MFRYLAYGSNLHPARLTARVGPVDPPRVVELQGWRLSFDKRSRDGSAKCRIVHTGQRKDQVWGALYALSGPQQRTLHSIEGVGAGYQVTHLELADLGEVFTYTAMAAYVSGELTPFEWYVEWVLAGARFHGFPKDYVGSIAAIAAQRDPDADRDCRHRQLLAASI